MSNIHDGHRKRMKDKFRSSGADSFEPHEILEMLLYFGIPRVNTNEIAHILIQKFHGYTNVFEAPFEELVSVKGMTKNAAALIKLVPELAGYYYKDSISKQIVMNSIENITSYFSAKFSGMCGPCVLMCCLDDELSVKSCHTAASGGVELIPDNIRKMAEIVYRTNTSRVIIAHNVTSGSPVPTDQDVAVTKHLYKTFASLDIILEDHIIAGNEVSVSMKELGYFSNFG